MAPAQAARQCRLEPNKSRHATFSHDMIEMMLAKWHLSLAPAAPNGVKRCAPPDFVKCKIVEHSLRTAC